MKALAGTGSLIRFILRRDRIRLTVWILAVVGYTVPLIASLTELYPTPESRQARALLMDGPLGVAFSGPRIGLDNYTFGAMASNEFLGVLAVALALMSVFLVVRHTRLEEESGRSELVRAAVVGRHASTTAVLVVVIGAQVAIGVLIALLLPQAGIDLSTSGSWLFAAAVVSVGAAFAGVTAIAAQVTSHPRGAVGIGAAAVGVGYLIRAVGDIGDGALSMLSPIGWAQATQPYVNDTWSPLAISVVFVVITITVAFLLSARRDLGESLVAPRPGSAEGSPSLGRPFGLAFRLQRGLVIGWGVGLFVLAATYGGFVADVEEFASDNPFIEEALAAIGGGTLGESWASFLALFMVAFIASFVVQSILRLRSEESGLRAEMVLATPVERWRWMGSHLLVAGLGAVLLALLTGLGFGASAASVTGQWSWIPSMIGATLSHLPSIAVVGGFALAMFGLLPRLTSLAWAVIVVVWVGLMGVILGLPEWVSNLSPLGHGAMLPAADLELLPLVLLSSIAAVLVVAGFTGFGRRDVGAG